MRTTVHSSQFVVGSFDRLSRTYSMSATPKVHTDYQSALHEAQRLALQNPNKKYIVWAAVAVAEQDIVPVKTSYSL